MALRFEMEALEFVKMKDNSRDNLTTQNDSCNMADDVEKWPENQVRFQGVPK